MDRTHGNPMTNRKAQPAVTAEPKVSRKENQMHSITPVNSEAKPLTSLQRVVHILSDFQDHENTEFFRAYMPRYGARVHDLRQRGIQIASKRLDASRYQFRLVPAKDVIDKIKSIMPDDWEPRILQKRWF